MSVFLSLGQKIRDFRLKKAMTQIELAKGLCTPSMISQIESDRARPSYKILHALAERLGVPLEHLLKDVNLDLEYTSKHKLVIGLVRSKEYRSAIPLLQELLQNPHHRISNSDLHLELACCHLEIGNTEDAITHLDVVFEQATVRQDHDLLATCFFQLGRAYQQKRENAIAMFHTKRALDEVYKATAIDPVLHAKILIQLASIYEQSGKVAEAINFYDQALLLNQGKLEERGLTFLRLAEAHQRQGDYSKADEFASKAMTLLEEQSHVDQQQEWKHRLLLLKSKQGDWKRCTADLLQIAEQYERTSQQEKAGVVIADIAMIQLENDSLDESCIFAEKAKMLLSHHHPAMGIVHRVLAAVSFARQDATKGQKHLDNSFAILEQHGKLAELEEITMFMCHHLSDTGNDEEAFLRFKQFYRFMRKSLDERGIAL